MKRNEKINEESFLRGYEKGRQDAVNKVLKFIDKESEFLADIHSDALLDRLVKFIKKI